MTNNLESKTTINKKMKNIYKLHNGIALANDLRTITEDRTFEYISSDDDTYTFKNKQNQVVVIDSQGNLCKSDIDAGDIFSMIGKRRLLRTENMFDAVWS